jgi:CRP-like cAMP-binding protein
LINGSVDVFETVNAQNFKLATLGPGEIVGEMASITHGVRSATVVAAEATEVLIITRELMVDELQKLPPWLERIVVSMADRVRNLDKRIHPHRCGDYSLQVISQLNSIFDDQAVGSESDVSICTDLAALCEELYLLCGLERLETEPLLRTLVDAGMLASGSTGLQPRSLVEFGRFTDFCRMSSGARAVRGVRVINGVNLSAEEEPRFRNLRHKLREACSYVTGVELPSE